MILHEIIVMLGAAGTIAATVATASAAAKCTSVQAQCAVEIGGTAIR